MFSNISKFTEKIYMGVWFQITVPLFYINGEVILRLSFTGEEEISWSHV